MKVIKRDGRQVEYDRNKIAIAIEKANEGVEKEERISEDKIYNIIASIESRGADMMQVEDIQDIIEKKLMSEKKYELAKAYIKYRYTRELVRKSNTTDDSILSLIKTATKMLWKKIQTKMQLLHLPSVTLLLARFQRT